MPRYLNDGSTDAPKLSLWLNLDNLHGLKEGSLWPIGLESDPSARDQQLAKDGFAGVQITLESGPASPVLPHCGLGRINHPTESDALFARHAERGDKCLTLHVGWGWEEDREVGQLVESVLTASERYALPAFIETHRATITQDVWRTVQITKWFPEVLFNGDFSHYYCGQEMVYGDWQTRLEFMAPLFSRIGFMHGRIASPGCMQASIGTDFRARPRLAYGQADYLAHFRDLWTHAMRGFIASAGPGDVLVFAPELLSGEYYYARVFQDSAGRFVEEDDRYAQALIYQNLAQSCFAAAQASCTEATPKPSTTSQL